MKSLVLFVGCMLGFVGLKAQTYVYHPFPDSNATWASTYDDFNPGYRYDRFYLDGDTIMEGRKYNKVYDFLSWDQRNYIGGIRQDTAARKVYAKLINWMYPIYPPSIFLFSDTSDVLLYDFSLEIGDSIIIPSIFSYYQYMYVINTDSIEIQGSYRKYLVLNSQLHPWVYSYWIEGIGSLNGLFWPRFDQEFGVCNLECMSQEGLQLYIMDGGTVNCPYIPNSLPFKKINSQFGIYPNPANDLIHIELPYISNGFKIVDILIYNAEARLIAEQKNITLPNSTVFNCEALPEGLCLIKIAGNDGASITKKIIIKH